MRQNGFIAEVIKTDIVNVDDSSHHLPPHNGSYKEFKVADYYCPEEWSNDGVFIPVKEGDPLWFDFRGNDDECAILCAVQRINPVTGDPADLEEGLAKDPAQNYLRMPEQRWLDGYAKDGKVYQFVVTKAGIGLAVNEYVLPKHMQDSHAIGFAFFGPKNPKPIYPRNITTKGMSQPMWFSPTADPNKMGCQMAHTPQNWIMRGHQKYGCSGGMSSGSTIMDFGGISESLTGGDMHNIEADSLSDDAAQIFCCNSVETDADPLVIGDGANARFTQNRVADDYVEPVEERPDIETVDILAAQEADLTELDKASMGAGGRITQSIATDDNTTDYYHEKRSALLTIYFALPEMYDAIMKKGKRQDASKKDKYKTSGHIGGVAVPLVTQDQ